MAKSRTKSSGPSAIAALTAAASKAPAKKAAAKKSTMPQTQLDADDARHIKNWLEGDDFEKRGKALKAEAEEVLIEEGRDFLSDQSMKKGAVVKSVRLAGSFDYEEDGEEQHFDGSVRVTQAAKWLKMGAPEKEQLEAEFTDADEFNRLFEVDQSFTIDLQALNERKGLADRLVKALGDDADILSLAVSVKPTEAFLTEVMTNKAMTKRWEKLQVDGLCKLQKPSFGR